MGNLVLFLPEFTILAGALLAFLLSAIGVSERRSWLGAVVLAGAALAVSAIDIGTGAPFFVGIYRVDLFSQVLKLGVVGGLFLTVLMSESQGSVRPETRIDMPIFYFLSALGMMMLVSATELLTLYVALELSAYGLYTATALQRSRREGSEAGIKYVLFGAASSAVSLYGISLIYGATGTTYLAQIASQLGGEVVALPVLVVGVVLALSGVLFKLAVFPFHSWAPDVYQGSPHQAASFIGTASKVAAVGVLLRFLMLLPEDSGRVQMVIVILSVASMTVGNLAALIQKDLKRLLAYSTVAHAGYILIGLACFTTLGNAAAIFYVLLYVPIAVCVFVVVCALGADGSNPTKSSLAGLYKRSPLLAASLLVGMFGLAGIPPTVGFAGKWFLFTAAVGSQLFWLVLVAAINATVSLYYYLIVIREAYLTPPADDSKLVVPGSLKLVAVISMAAVVVAGFYPGPLWNYAKAAASVLTL